MNFLESTINTFEKNKKLAESAFTQLEFDKWREPLSPDVNSIITIMKHVSGNLKSRWSDFLTSDGEKPWRNRDSEFIDDFSSKEAAINYWNEGWETLFSTLQSLSDVDLDQKVYIRGEEHSVFLAVQRSLSHTSYHIGQIVQISRILAADNWKVLTIPRGESEKFNNANWKK